ncbi:MAG: hypothetical protein PHD06_00810 [Bacteroidales bacterium]|jgi:uncharacterized protein YacL|nr:hypothetical protein [Bacteroidales bacterium]MDD4383695.1 hypothetical protein [Bacteroidales bacterium]MDY0196226.1 hypothetical protein [Tenuifilaceae bacterium]
MITPYIIFSISITFFSWIVGMFIGAILKKTKLFDKLSSLNFIKSKDINKKIGLGILKWIVTHTFLKFFNPMKLKNKIEISELYDLRKEMTTAEINHLIGFILVIVFPIIKFINGDYLFALIFIIVNILMNLYPSLLQQENKRRIDRLIKTVANKM